VPRAQRMTRGASVAGGAGVGTWGEWCSWCQPQLQVHLQGRALHFEPRRALRLSAWLVALSWASDSSNLPR